MAHITVNTSILGTSYKITMFRNHFSDDIIAPMVTHTENLISLRLVPFGAAYLVQFRDNYVIPTYMYESELCRLMA